MRPSEAELLSALKFKPNQRMQGQRVDPASAFNRRNANAFL